MGQPRCYKSKTEQLTGLVKARLTAGETGYTQQKVAEEVGISLTTYNNYESGKINPPVRVAKKICDFVHCGIEVFF